MIFEYPALESPVRQGDIFTGLPRVDLSLKQVILCEEESERIVPWKELAGESEPLNVMAAVRSVAAIVVTQDCDAARSRDITLCEIRKFREVELKAKETVKPKAWKNILTQHARINQKWFYLPVEPRIGFEDKMAVDFLTTLRIPREDLESLRNLRRARLNSVAYEHFRERIAEFFRRYPYDEWYALDKDEMREYKKEYPDAQPYPWQSPSVLP